MDHVIPTSLLRLSEPAKPKPTTFDIEQLILENPMLPHPLPRAKFGKDSGTSIK